MVLASGFFIWQTIKEVNTTISLRSDINEAKVEKAELEEQKAMFEQEKSNLNNDEYIVRYARGKYMLTKEDGEQVFKLPSEGE